MDIKLKGCLYGAAAASTYGMNPLFAVTLYGDGMNPDSVLLFRYMFALPILALMIKMRGHDFRLTMKEAVSLFIVGMLVATSSLTLYMSYNYMPAGIASTMLFVYPVIVAVLMTVFFGERVKLLTVLCIALAVGGIAMLYKGDGATTLNPIGCIIVLCSSLSYALYIVLINRDIYKYIPTLKLTFYTLLFGTTLFMARILLGSEQLVCPPPIDGICGLISFVWRSFRRCFHLCGRRWLFSTLVPHRQPYLEHWSRSQLWCSESFA